MDHEIYEIKKAKPLLSSLPRIGLAAGALSVTGLVAFGAFEVTQEQVPPQIPTPAVAEVAPKVIPSEAQTAEPSAEQPVTNPNSPAPEVVEPVVEVAQPSAAASPSQTTPEQGTPTVTPAPLDNLQLPGIEGEDHHGDHHEHSHDDSEHDD